MNRTADRRSVTRSAEGLFTGAVILALAWSAFAFGAVYPWAYAALIPLAVIAGAIGLFARRDQTGFLPSRQLRYAFGAIVAAALLQLVPLPTSLLKTLSPETDRALAALQLSYAAGIDRFHPLSIDPGGTVVGLLLFASFALLLVGLTRMFSISGVTGVADGIVVLGAALALVGIIQLPLYNGTIYGLWHPQSAEAKPFGPFVNRNHFAGWMLMALPICVARLLVAITDRGRRRRETVREWIVWLGTDTGHRAMILALTAATMGLSLVMTMSRSGITSFALSLAVGGWLFSRGVVGAGRKTMVAVGLALLISIAIGWTGTNVVAERFAKLDANEFALRQGAWIDAMHIASVFPWFGTGLNTYGSATLLYQTADPTYHYAEAHNDYLQLAAEGGVLLVLPALLAVVFFVREALQRAADAGDAASWWIRRGALIGLLAMSAQELVEFSLQMPANAALFAVLGAMALHRAPKPAAMARERMSRPEHATSTVRTVYA